MTVDTADERLSRISEASASQFLESSVLTVAKELMLT